MNATLFQSLQAYYSLAARDVERELVPLLEADGVGLMVWSPLSGGYLTGKYRDGSGGRRTAVPFPPVDGTKGEPVLAAMDGIAAAHGVPMAAIALAWLLHQRVVTSLILGAKRVDQLEDHLKADEITLSADELKTLDVASALAPEYPGWMLQQSNAPRQTLLDTGLLPPDE